MTLSRLGRKGLGRWLCRDCVVGCLRISWTFSRLAGFGFIRVGIGFKLGESWVRLDLGEELGLGDFVESGKEGG